MSLTITTVLAIITQCAGVFQTAPETSYFKAIDVWLMVCFNFTFLVLVEFIVIIFLTNRAKLVRKYLFCSIVS